MNLNYVKKLVVLINDHYFVGNRKNLASENALPAFYWKFHLYYSGLHAVIILWNSFIWLVFTRSLNVEDNQKSITKSIFYVYKYNYIATYFRATNYHTKNVSAISMLDIFYQIHIEVSTSFDFNLLLLSPLIGWKV